MKPSILILYSGIGHGHKRLAENIAHHLADSYDVDVVNLFDVEAGSSLVSSGSRLFLWMVEHAPWLWNFFYTNKIFLSLTLPLRRPFASRHSKKLLTVINAKRYNAIISCHAMTSAIVSSLKARNKFNGKLIVAFSDYHLHPYWMFENVDLYLANIPEQKKEMVARGVPPEKIAVIGMTLKQMLPVDVFNVKRTLGVAQDKKVVLVMGGTSGYGIDRRAIDELQKSAVAIVVCGQNKELHDELVLHARGNSNLKVFGYVDNLPELYATADLLVSKPGGLTIAECLQRNLPVLVTSFMPGQEKLNFDYLVRNSLILTDYAKIKHEILMKQFNEALMNSLLRKQIVQDDGRLVREAVGAQIYNRK